MYYEEKSPLIPKKIVKINDSEIKEKINLANRKFKDQKFQEAGKIYDELFKSGVRNYEFLLSYGIFNKKTRNYSLAKSIFVFIIKNYSSFLTPYISLADILIKEQKFNDAEKILLLAKNINKSNGDVNYNLAIVYNSTGKFKEAYEYINIAINLSNKNVIYYILKAEILINNNNYDLALSILSEIEESKEKRINIPKAILISKVYTLKKDFVKSEDVLLKLKSKYNNEIFIYLDLSNIYFELKDLEKAIHILKEGIKLAPNFIPLKFNLAIMYKNIGEISTAKNLFLDIILTNINHFDSFYELSRIYGFENHKEEINYLLNLNIEKLSISDRIKVAFAKANIFTKKKNFFEGSSYMKIANDEHLKLFPSDFQLKYKTGEHYKNLVFKNKSEKKIRTGDDLIFIVGMPRSGSTLLESILSLNSKVVDMGEVSFLEESLKESKKYSDVFSKYINKRDLIFKNTGGIFTDKNLFNYFYIPIIYNFFPNSKIIHCIRNPLDNILSIYRTNFRNQNFSSSLVDITNLYVYQVELTNHYKKKYGSFIYNYYHDQVIQNPSNQIPTLIKWLGWEWDEKYLYPDSSDRAVFTASSVQIRAKINSKSLGEWKNFEELLKPAIEILSKTSLLK